MMRRVVSAFVYRDAELARVPFPRGTTTMLLSAVVAAALLGAVAIYGVVVKGGNSRWRDSTTVVVEKQSGARYVYLDGQLHPVLNYASARLILKQQNPAVVYVSAASIAGVRRGAPLGIPGAPDTLPVAGKLVSHDWRLCSQSDVDTSAGRTVQRTVLFLGPTPAQSGSQLGDQAVLARHPDGSVFLVWHNSRFLIRSPDRLLDALALGQSPILPAAAAWINAIPQGPDIAPIAIPDRGRPSAVPGALTGQVVATRRVTGEEEFYAVLADGVAAITALQADVLLHDPATAAAYPGQSPQPLVRTDLGTVRQSGTHLLPAGDGVAPPTLVPGIAPGARPDGDLCLVYPPGSTAPTVLVGAALPVLGPATSLTAAADGPLLAYRVLLTPGTGVLARTEPGNALSVITDLGVRYPLAQPEVASYLGYRPDAAAILPANLAALIPAGPALDPTAARQPVPVR